MSLSGERPHQSMPKCPVKPQLISFATSSIAALLAQRSSAQSSPQGWSESSLFRWDLHQMRSKDSVSCHMIDDLASSFLAREMTFTIICPRSSMLRISSVTNVGNFLHKDVREIFTCLQHIHLKTLKDHVDQAGSAQGMSPFKSRNFLGCLPSCSQSKNHHKTSDSKPADDLLEIAIFELD